MKPDKTSAVQLFNAPRQYVIPVFQRGYVWTLERQVAPLWADIEERALAWLDRQELLKTTPSSSFAPLRKHFLGSVVLAPLTGAFGRVPAYEVIDGQQRTTTLHLLLLAFSHAAKSVLADPQIAQMLGGLVRNPEPLSVQSDKHKVWPTKAGREEIDFLGRASEAEAVCAEYPAIVGKSRRERPLMVQAYLYLHEAIVVFLSGGQMDDPQSPETDSTLADAVIHSVRRDNRPHQHGSGQFSLNRAQALYMALSDAVQLMTLTLEGDDDPQVIFETLNARGEPLLASDLVRNYVFLDAARRDFDVVANERQGRINHPRIDLFFFHYTVLRAQQETKVGHVFQTFKEWWQSAVRDPEAELARMVKTSGYFRQMISPDGTDFLAEFGRLVKVLDVSTLSPVYLFLREHYESNAAELRQALVDLSSYLARRAVCGYTTKGYNRIFLRMLEAISRPGVASPARALREFLLSLDGVSVCWPSDREFREHWMYRPVYKELRPAKTAAILRALEVAQRGVLHETNFVPTTDLLTVEHILPQGWEASGHYPMTDASESRIHHRNQIVHSFGNLTLLTQELNSTVSNGPFLDTPLEDGARLREGKRSQICRYSLLNLNAYLQGKQEWDEVQIAQRAEVLFGQAMKVWPRPYVD
jgi:hypothetical protein